jgi:tetratricopeptide (TPR) repeat protein
LLTGIIRLNALNNNLIKEGSYEKSISLSKKITSRLKNALEDPHIKKELADEAALNYENLGYVFLLKGFLEEALENFKCSLELFNRLSANSHDIARLCNHIGTVYSHKLNFLKALEYFARSYSIYTKKGTGDAYQAAVIQNNMGYIYSRLSYTSYKKRKFYKQKALKLFQSSFTEALQCGAGSLAAQIKNNISVLYLKTGDFVNARKAVKESMKMYTRLNVTPSELAVIYHNYGNYYYKTGKFV